MRFQLDVRVYRGQVVESRHELHAALADPGGRLLSSTGSPALVTMFRSAAKPFQLLPLVERGHAERWGFSDEQLALMVASHTGSAYHLQVVKGILGRIGLGPEHLACGYHDPDDPEALALLRGGGAERSPLYNNCSGQHAGLMALARSEGWPIEGYHLPGHPVQQLLHRTLAEICRLAPESIPTAVDGCSLVVYALPLQVMARCYAILAAAAGSPGTDVRTAALGRIVRAMTTHPRAVEGHGRISTALMEATAGRVLAKSGAEGLQLVALLDREQASRSNAWMERNARSVLPWLRCWSGSVCFRVRRSRRWWRSGKRSSSMPPVSKWVRLMRTCVSSRLPERRVQPSGGHALKRIVFTLLAGVALLALAHAARAAGPFPRLDPRLASALVPGTEPVSVWVEFADKGEQLPADLAAALAGAERDLTPACRARRIRAGVKPLVDYLDVPISPAYLRLLEAQGLRPYGTSRWFNGVAVHVAGEQLARLAALDCVRRLSPAQLAAPRARRPVPPDERTVLPLPPVPSREFGGGVPPGGYGMTADELARLNVTALHDSGYVGTGVLVCMFDEGFNYYTKHTATLNIDVGNRTRDFVRGGTDVQDTVNAPGLYQHGQWTLSAIGGNAPGIFVGPAYGARYALARTEDSGSEKPIEMVNWLMASEWADSLGADIISSSLGYLTFPDSAGTSLTPAQLDGHTAIVTRAAEIAAAKGILVVNSAGNGGPFPNTLDAPADACGDSMLAVGAVNSSGILAGFSSRGPTADGRTKPDLVAEGVLVLLASASGLPNNYVSLSGTSFSCPLTAGVAACLIQARPSWTLTQLVRAMKLGASRASNPDNDYGWGLVNALGALNFDTAGVPAGHVAQRLSLKSVNPMQLGRAPASLRFGLAAGAAASEYAVRVYDVTGRLVRTLWTGWLNPDGVGYTVPWDGTEPSGRMSRPGLYLVSLESGHQRTSIRVIAIR